MLREKIKDVKLEREANLANHEKPTFRTVCHQWLEHKKKSCTPITIESYKLKVTKYLLNAPFVDKPIDAIQHDEIKQCLNALRANCNINCIHGIRSILNKVLNYAIKMGWIKYNPAKANTIEEEYLTVEETGYRTKYKKQSLYNLIHKGTFILGIHYFKPTPKKVLFKWSEIQKWIGDTSIRNHKDSICFNRKENSKKNINFLAQTSQRSSINI